MSIDQLKAFIVLTLLLFANSCQQKKQHSAEKSIQEFHWKQYAIQNSTMRQQIDSFQYNINQGIYGYIDEVFISRNDSIIIQKKYSLNYDSISKKKIGKMGCGSNMCEDSGQVNLYNYYHPKYHPYYLNSDLHTIQSVTKSVVSTIIGHAIFEGKLTGVRDSIYQYFANYDLSDSMTQHLQTATLQDLLTMRLGLEWKESGMTLEMETDVSAMELSDDWIDYVLHRKITAEPGKQWLYSSGVSQLFSQIIKGATGQTIETYAKQTLFKKLGIKDFYWKKSPTGLPDAEGGLYLRAEDLAKIGLLHLKNGIWNGERLLSSDWVKEALSKQVQDIYGDGGKEGYGYQWWITGDKPPLAVGLGYGNQMLIIMPEHGIIGVVYAWNIFDNEGRYIFRDLVQLLSQVGS